MILNFKTFVQSSVIIGSLFTTVISCGDNKSNKNTEASSPNESSNSKSEILKLIPQVTKLQLEIGLLQIYLKDSNSYLFDKNTLIFNNVNFGDIDKILDHISVPVSNNAVANIRILLSDDGSGKYSDVMGIPSLIKTMKFEYDSPYPDMTEVNRKKEEIKKQISEVQEILKTAKEKISTEIKDSPGKQLILNGGKNKKGEEVAGLTKLSQMALDAKNILK